MCDQRERARTESRTDACPKSSSTARNSAPIGLGNVDHQRQLQILAASLHSLGRTARTVAWTAVGQATDDMDMALGAQIHAEWLKTSNLYPRMRSATKHVHPCTESLASPLHAGRAVLIPHFEPLANSPRAKMRTGPRDSVRMVQIKNLFRTPSKSSRSRPWGGIHDDVITK